MKKRQRKKTRSIASYRAASLKGARTKQRMADAMWDSMIEDMYHRATTPAKFVADFKPPKTIDLIPKVKWP